MKNFIFMFIVILIILSIFAYYIKTQKVDYQNATASKSVQVSKDDIFEKNKVCFSEKQKIEAEISKNNNIDWQEQLTEVFYTPKLNSCLYISEVQTGWYSLKRLVDYRSFAGGEPIESCTYPVPVLMATVEMEAEKNNNKEILDLLKKDRARSYESVCGQFDTRVAKLKEI